MIRLVGKRAGFYSPANLYCLARLQRVKESFSTDYPTILATVPRAGSSRLDALRLVLHV